MKTGLLLMFCVSTLAIADWTDQIYGYGCGDFESQALEEALFLGEEKVKKLEQYCWNDKGMFSSKQVDSLCGHSFDPPCNWECAVVFEAKCKGVPALQAP